MIWASLGSANSSPGIPSYFPESSVHFLGAVSRPHRNVFGSWPYPKFSRFLAPRSLFTGEFLARRAPRLLQWMLVWSLFIFVQLGFGQWLTADFISAAQIFTYFAGTLVALHYVDSRSSLPRS